MMYVFIPYRHTCKDSNLAASYVILSCNMCVYIYMYHIYPGTHMYVKDYLLYVIIQHCDLGFKPLCFCWLPKLHLLQEIKQSWEIQGLRISPRVLQQKFCSDWENLANGWYIEDCLWCHCGGGVIKRLLACKDNSADHSFNSSDSSITAMKDTN